MENEERFKWCGYEWICQDHIKNDNENYKDAYFAPEAVYLENGVLHLGIIRKPTRWKDIWTQADPPKRVFKPIKLIEINKKPITIPPRFGQNKGDVNNPWPVRIYGVGEVSSINKFSYGTFTWKARLPQGAYLWPALWLSGAEHWPPEIDAMEAYSDAKGSYLRDRNLYTKIETNIHYEENEKHKHMGPRGIHDFLWRVAHKNDWDEWKVEWTPSHVNIFFNGVIIRSMWSKRALKTLNEHPSMEVIMNMMILKGFDNNTFEESGKNAELLVKEFKYQSRY